MSKLPDMNALLAQLPEREQQAVIQLARRGARINQLKSQIPALNRPCVSIHLTWDAATVEAIVLGAEDGEFYFKGGGIKIMRAGDDWLAHLHALPEVAAVDKLPAIADLITWAHEVMLALKDVEK